MLRCFLACLGSGRTNTPDLFLVGSTCLRAFAQDLGPIPQ